jgi:isopenicillin-N epimerase
MHSRLRRQSMKSEASNSALRSGTAWTGAIYIRRSKLGETDLCLGNRDDPADDIRSRIYSGTCNFAVFLAIPTAIGFHHQLTVERKGARLQYLRDYWVARVRETNRVEILTPAHPARYGATTTYLLEGMKSFEQTKQVRDLLLAEDNVLTVARKDISRGAAVRVTPALYSTTADLDKLIAAIRQEHGFLV